MKFTISGVLYLFEYISGINQIGIYLHIEEKYDRNVIFHISHVNLIYNDLFKIK
jgi:hypothetical protein